MFFNDICPLVAKLLSLIATVNIVENGKFGTWQPEEVANLNETDV